MEDEVIHLDSNNHHLIEGKQYEVTISQQGLSALYSRYPQHRGKTTFKVTAVKEPNGFWFQIPAFGPKQMVNPSFCSQIKSL